MARVVTTQDVVIDRVIVRLLAQIPTLTESTCFLSLDPEPLEMRISPAGVFVTVSPMGGEFDGLDGGGSNQVFELSGVIVSVFSPIRLDQKQHAEQALSSADRGLLILKRKILKALAGHDLVNAAGNQLLINYMAPRQSQHPQQMAMSEKFVRMSLLFSTDFEWDMT